MGFLGNLVMKPEAGGDKSRERGMALISALMAMTMVLALGMAIVFSATTDTVTSKIARQTEQAFFVADAGVGIARHSLAQALQDQLAVLAAGLNADPQTANAYRNIAPTQTGQFPDVQLLPDPDSTDGRNSPFYQAVIANATALCNSDSTRNSRLSTLNGSKFSVTYGALSGTLSLVPATATQATQVMVFRYSFKVTGKTDGGGTAVVNESGRLSTNIVLTVPGTSTRNFSFSGFGAFFDYGDTQANAPLASGTFTGPVHTNTHFAFLSSRQVAFRNVVSQVENQIRYDDTGSTNTNRAIPGSDITGIDISAEGYQQVARVPLPTNNFSQEYSVINSTGITDLGTDGLPVDKPAAMPTSPGTVFDTNGRVTATTLALNLRNASGAAPTISSGAIASGVYVSSTDGTTISNKGAGIYVQGNASDIQLIADTNGDQVYVIQQGATTTTIRTSYTNNTTAISVNGGSTRTYTGVFKDRADPNNVQNGAMLFVNGSIDSLRGGKDSSINKSAVSANTRLTITAQADITITGELKYANPVVDQNGVPVSGVGSIKNVLGIFTNDGNVNLAPSATYVSGSGLSLEMDAAVVSFNANTSNDGGAIKGSIVFTGGTTPGTNDRWKLVGSRVQSKINSIGFTYRDIYFDSRFSGGKFAPPFFPGTNYALAPGPAATDLTVVNVATPAATAMSWFRDNN
jgi:hypothetical protein